MQVSKWGASLAVRVPKALAKDMGLRAGDEVDLVALGRRKLGLRKIDKRSEFLDRLREFNWPAPEGYKFDRDEANER
ncbi:MAG TPA: AbrB/MazE/SpoVT family DNA-binding domain-containing protein [Roseiarcus sp.]|nr:AbrB/MazE/SpoVT family DNA-binding domain-containing protein [Roseiarcus sp.]